MEKYSCYLVCKEYIQEIRKFLGKFFNEVQEGYQSHQWITFKPKNSDFYISLMKGEEGEPLTHYMTFEISFDSLKKLEEFAKKHKVKIKNFKVTNTPQKYIYYYAEIMGPKEICKIEANYIKDIN